MRKERKMKTKSNITRGLRNNNPGNIRLSKQPWRGEVRPGRDQAFCTFQTIEYGYRALLKLLRNYRLKHSCRTIRQMIERWAPPSENHTEAYIRTVCKRTGMLETCAVNIDSKREMCKLAEAISYQENGVAGNMPDIEAGWELL